MNNPTPRLMIILLTLLLAMVLLSGYLRNAEAREVLTPTRWRLITPASRWRTYPPLRNPVVSYLVPTA